MDVARLVQLLLRHAIASVPTVQRRLDTPHSVHLCISHHYQSLKILCKFIAWLALLGLAHSLIKVYLSSNSHLHLMRYGADPDLAPTPRGSTGIKMAPGYNGLQYTAPAPANHELNDVLPQTSVGGSGAGRLQTHHALGSFMRKLLRLSPVRRCHHTNPESVLPVRSPVHIGHLDGSRMAPTSVAIRITASKTDPFRLGINIQLGRTRGDLCPVAALLSYIALRGLHPGPLFTSREGIPLTRQALVKEIGSALASVGIDPSPFSGHSFRIGAAVADGVEDSVIKTLGRWQNT